MPTSDEVSARRPPNIVKKLESLKHYESSEENKGPNDI